LPGQTKEKTLKSAKRKGFVFELRNKGTRARRASHSCWSYRIQIFSRYIQEQVENRSLQIPDSISRRIIVHFWIDTTGNVVVPEIIRGLNESPDPLTCGIVLDSPVWIPGK